jgi:predicted acetyltransferase
MAAVVITAISLVIVCSSSSSRLKITVIIEREELNEVIMKNYRLIYPNKEYKEKAYDYIKEFKQYNSVVNGTGGLERYSEYDDWLKKLDDDLDIQNIPEDRVPAHTYFLIRVPDNKIIGMINIRHKLNEFLYREGGHIGYSIRPTERQKGYGALILSLGLKKCTDLNMNKVLVTCDKANIASAKVICKNNGILENEIYSETCSETVQRYWIDLDIKPVDFCKI